MRVPLSFRRSVLLPVSLLACLASARAQDVGAGRGLAEDPRATVTGTVLTANGVTVPGVVILVSRPDGTAVARAVSGDLGNFRIAGLPPGRYTLTASAPGLATVVMADVGVGATPETRLDVRMDVAGISETVTILGTTPRDSLEATSIRESAARDVGEALATTMGLWKLRKGGMANEVVIRGFQSRDVNVLIDGQRVYGACPNHMDPPAFHVDFAEVERIEIGKGPFDVKEQGGLGGTINVVTRRPETGWHGMLTMAGGSAGYVNPATTLMFGRARVSVLGGFSYRRSRAYEDGNDRRFTELANYRPDRVDAEAFRVATGWSRAAVRVSDGQLLQVAYTRQQADQVLYPYLQMDGISDDMDRWHGRFDRGARIGPFTQLSVSASYARVDHRMTDQFRTSSTAMPRGYSMGTQADTGTATGKLESALRGVELGLDFVRREWNSTTQMAAMQYATQHSLPDTRIDTIGLYAQRSQPLGPRITLLVGGRLDHARSTADPGLANTALYFAYKGTRRTAATDLLPGGTLRLTWTPAASVSLSAGIGHAARVAEGNERYFALRRMGSDWVGNPELTPSRNTGVDVNLTWRRRGAAVTTSVFWNAIDGFIAVHDQARVNMVPGVMNTQARSYANVMAHVRGAEVMATTPLAGPVFLSADLSYVRGTQDPNHALGIRSGHLAEMPPLRSTLRLRFDDGRYYLVAEEQLHGQQTRINVDLGEQPTPGAALTNLSGGVRVGSLAVTAGVANLFDRLYVEHLSFQRDPFRSGVRVPEPGRTAFVNAVWRF